MTTTTYDTIKEVTAADVEVGDVVGLRDAPAFGRYDSQYVVLIVTGVYRINRTEGEERIGWRYLDGIIVFADNTDIPPQPTMPTVADAEPVDVYAHMDISDWSADYAQRAIHTLRGEVKE